MLMNTALYITRNTAIYIQLIAMHQSKTLRYTLLPSSATTFKSFEISTVTFKLPHSKLTLFNIYRPPSSFAKSRDAASFSQFLEDFQTLISSVSTTPFEFLIATDVNIHVGNPSDPNALKFISLLDLVNLTQHVSFATHCH
jgi:hypothetical protein